MVMWTPNVQRVSKMTKWIRRSRVISILTSFVSTLVAIEGRGTTSPMSWKVRLKRESSERKDGRDMVEQTRSKDFFDERRI